MPMPGEPVTPSPRSTTTWPASTLPSRTPSRASASDSKTMAGPAEAAGLTSFFVGEDVNTDERQALPLAAEQLAGHLVSQLSEGW